MSQLCAWSKSYTLCWKFCKQNQFLVPQKSVCISHTTHRQTSSERGMATRSLSMGYDARDVSKCERCVRLKLLWQRIFDQCIPFISNHFILFTIIYFYLVLLLKYHWKNNNNKKQINKDSKERTEQKYSTFKFEILLLRWANIFINIGHI